MIKQKDVEIALFLMFIIMLAVFTVSPKARQPIGQVLLNVLGTTVIVTLIQILGNAELQKTNGSMKRE